MHSLSSLASQTLYTAGESLVHFVYVTRNALSASSCKGSCVVTADENRTLQSHGQGVLLERRKGAHHFYSLSYSPLFHNSVAPRFYARLQHNLWSSHLLK